MRSHRISVYGSAALLLAGAAFLTLSAKASSDAPAPTPQTKEGGPICRITATTENIADSHDAIRIDLIGWSNDADRAALPKAWDQALARAAALAAAKAKGEVKAAPPPKPTVINGRTVAPPPAPKELTPRSSLYDALEKGATLGYVWAKDEISGYTVKYAVKEPEAGGGERILLITDRKLGDDNDHWKFVGPQASKFNNAVAKPGPNSDTGSDLGPNQYDEFSIIELHVNARGEGEGKISATYKIGIDTSKNVIQLLDYKDLPVVFANVHMHDESATDKKS